MKVLIVVSKEIGNKHGGSGGDPAQVLGFIHGFKKLGHEVIYASKNPQNCIKNGECEYEDIQYLQLYIPKLSGLANQLHIIRSVEGLITKHNPSLIYFYWPENVFITKLKKYNIPIVMVCNTPKSMHTTKLSASYFDKLNLKTSTLVTAVSREITDFLVIKFGEKLGKKVVTNPNGVDSGKFITQSNSVREKFGIEEATPIIGFSGYFAKWHRLDILINAVQDLEEDVKLLVMGTGPEKIKNELEMLASKKNRERFIFTGYVPFQEIPKYYSACDILAVPQDKDDSHRSPMKLFEYMSMAKAVAAANVGQLAEVINDGINGMLFEPEVEDLKKVLKQLLQNDNLRDELGQQARNDVIQHYSWEANVSRIINALYGFNKKLTAQ